MQQPFLIVFPFFISVFIVRVLPRVILAPVALLVFIFVNWWLDPGVEAGVVDQGPWYPDSTGRIFLPLP